MVKNMKRKIIGGILASFVLLAMVIFHQTQAEEDQASIALYDSAKIGVVERTIQLELKQGINEVPLDVLEGLDIGEITLKSLDEKVKVLGIINKEVPEEPIQQTKIEAFYLYKLGTVDIGAFETKMIPYIYQKTDFTREYLYESYPYGGAQDIYEIISLKTNDVLPKGIVEIYKEMEDKNVLIGEQMIDHTAKGDTLRLKLGRDIDLKGTTEVLEERHDDHYGYYKIRVTVENFGEESKEVIVRHYKWRGKILESSISPINETANYVEFKITVNPGEKEEIIFDYEVSY